MRGGQFQLPEFQAGGRLQGVLRRLPKTIQNQTNIRQRHDTSSV
jgi:hypothetical protein